MMATYVAVIAFFVAFLVITTVFDKPEYEKAMAVWEPFGMAPTVS